MLSTLCSEASGPSLPRLTPMERAKVRDFGRHLLMMEKGTQTNPQMGEENTDISDMFIWGFPEMVGFPPKSSIFHRVFHYKSSSLGFGNTHIQLVFEEKNPLKDTVDASEIRREIPVDMVNKWQYLQGLIHLRCLFMISEPSTLPQGTQNPNAQHFA